MDKNLIKNSAVSLQDALSFRNKAKKEKKTFVLTNGCFDLLHSGHVFSLIEASKLGDYLWVAINSDSSIKNLKGPKRPIVNEIDRAYLLTSLQCVAGVTIFEHSKVTMLAQTEGGVDITTDGGRINAQKVVIACNGYLDTLFAPIAGNIMPINNFIVATEPLDQDVAARLNPLNASLSDSLFVINYWKLSRDRRLIFGGGETYSDQFPDSITDFVRPKLLAIYPELSTTKLDFGWGGTLAITRNRMPDLGVHNGAVFYAQGFSGHGVPTATMAGKLIALAINGGHEDFDLMAGLKTRKFPGGPLLRRPSLIASMLFYSLRDRLGR